MSKHFHVITFDEGYGFPDISKQYEDYDKAFSILLEQREELEKDDERDWLIAWDNSYSPMDGIHAGYDDEVREIHIEACENDLCSFSP
jgi:hypothetical protein